MSLTLGDISSLDSIAVLTSDGRIELLILPHSTQIGLKEDPQPLLVSGPLYSQDNLEVIGTLRVEKAVNILSDLTVSGTLYAEKIIVEVDESVTGSLWVSGSLLVSQSASISKGMEVNAARGGSQGSGGDDFIVFGSSTGREIFSAHASSDQVLILSGGGGPTSPNEFNYSDMAFFVSGTVNSKGTAIKGVSVFGGDTLISGALYLDERSAPGTIADGTVALYGKEASGVTKLYFKNESGETEVGSGGGSTNPGGSDGQVQYNNGGSSFGGASNLYYDDSNNRVGIATTSPDYELDVAGSVGVDEYIYHNSDADTFIQFEDDTIYFDAGGRNFIKITEAGTDKLIVNNGALDIDLQVKGNSAANLIRTDAGNDSIYFGANSGAGADNNFWVSGSIGSRGVAERGTAVFGGDTVVSGALVVHGADTNTPNGTISGSIHVTSHGLSYLVAGSNVTITSQSNGQVSIAASSGGGGGGSGDYQAKTANFTVGTSEYMFGIDSSQGNLTGTLPAASSAGAGKQYIFKDSAGFAGNTSKGIHIATDSNTEKIDGSASANILVNSGSITVMTDGNNWFVIGVS